MRTTVWDLKFQSTTSLSPGTPVVYQYKNDGNQKPRLSSCRPCTGSQSRCPDAVNTSRQHPQVKDAAQSANQIARRYILHSWTAAPNTCKPMNIMHTPV